MVEPYEEAVCREVVKFVGHAKNAALQSGAAAGLQAEKEIMDAGKQAAQLTFKFREAVKGMFHATVTTSRMLKGCMP